MGVLRPRPELSQTDASFSRGVDASRWTTPACLGDGRYRFRGDVHELSPEAMARMQAAALGLVQAIDEAIRWIVERPELLRDYFHLPDAWARMATDGAPWWHAFARLDVFWTADARIQICEINADTPSGQTDMWALHAVLADGDDFVVPGRAYQTQLMALINRLVMRAPPQGGAPVFALVYPTDISEDLDLVRAYSAMARTYGFEVVRGAPQNLETDAAGDLWLFGRRVDLLLRHYKADWWGERRRVWFDSPPIPEPWPLAILDAVLRSEREGRVCIVNPMGALLAQTKTMFAFLWDHLEQWSADTRALIEAAIPRTRRLVDCSLEVLCAERERWVLKSDFGCEGGEVVVGRHRTPEAWRIALKLAIPERWVVQEFFEIEALADGALPNFGMYVVGGEVAGLYTRVNAPSTITGTGAQVLPVVLGCSPGRGDDE